MVWSDAESSCKTFCLTFGQSAKKFPRIPSQTLPCTILKILNGNLGMLKELIKDPDVCKDEVACLVRCCWTDLPNTRIIDKQGSSPDWFTPTFTLG